MYLWLLIKIALYKYYIGASHWICFILIDHRGSVDKAFAIAGANDTDAKSATTILTTPGFKASEHPRECLTFWYNIKVIILMLCIFLYNIIIFVQEAMNFTYNI